MTSSIKSIELKYPDSHAPQGMEQEIIRAIDDLCLEGSIRFYQHDDAPYAIEISLFNNQILFKITDSLGLTLPHLLLSLSPYRAIIRDYFMMIESYEKMRGQGNQSRLEPIDMARRGLHDEAATMMMERLKDKLEMDHATARRLFTLVCALHMDQARLWTPI